MNESLTYKLFSNTDCLSEETLFDYIDKKLSPENQHIVEKHMLNCEFCSDALVGLQLVKRRNSIQFINKKIDARIAKKSETKIIAFNYKTILSVAAALILLIGGVFFFNHFLITNDKSLAELKQETSVENTPTSSAKQEVELAIQEKLNDPVSINDTSASGLANLISQEEMVSESRTADGYVESPINLSKKEQKEDSRNFQRTDSNEGKTINSLTTNIPTITDNKAIHPVDANKEEIDRKQDIKSISGKHRAIEQSDQQTINLSNQEHVVPTAKSNVLSNNNSTKTDNLMELDNEKNSAIIVTKKIKEEKKNKAFKLKSTAKEKEKRTENNEPDFASSKEDAQKNNYDHDGYKDQIKKEKQNEIIASDTEVSLEISNKPEEKPKQTNKSISREEIFTAGLTNVDSAYFVVDEMPIYPGGDAEVINYLQKSIPNLSSEETNNNNKVSSLIYVQFIVNKEGKAVHPKILKNTNKDLEKVLINVINKMPLWKPGKLKGQVVNVKYNLPITTKLK